MISGVRASSTRIEVHLVHDAEIEVTLDHVLQPVLHVVAQIVEAKLVVGAVGDVGRVLGALGVVVLPVHDDADFHAEEAIDLPHPFGVAPGQVVVHGDDMDAIAGQGIQVDGQGGDQRLALASLHLGDLAVVQHHAAHQLNVEMPLAQRAPGCLAHRREGFRLQVVQGGATGQPLAEFGSLGAQGFVRQRLHGRFQRVDLGDPTLVSLEGPIVGSAEYGAGDGSEHGTFSDGRVGTGSRARPDSTPQPPGVNPGGSGAWVR